MEKNTYLKDTKQNFKGEIMQLGQSNKRTEKSRTAPQQDSDRFAPLDMNDIPVQPLVRASDGQIMPGRVFIDAPRGKQQTQLGIAPPILTVKPEGHPRPPPPSRGSTILGIVPSCSKDEWAKRKLIVSPSPLFGVSHIPVPTTSKADDELELIPDEDVVFADTPPEKAHQPDKPNAERICKPPQPANTVSLERPHVSKPNQPPPPQRIHVAAQASSHPPVVATPRLALPAIPPTPPPNTRLRSESAELNLRNAANASGVPQSRSVTPAPMQKPMFPPQGEDVDPDDDSDEIQTRHWSPDDTEFDEARTHHHPNALPKVVARPELPAGPRAVLTRPEPQAPIQSVPTPSTGFPKPPTVPTGIGRAPTSSKPPPRIGGTTRPPQQSVAPQGGQVKRPTLKDLDSDIQTMHERGQTSKNVLRLIWDISHKKPATFPELRRIEAEFQRKLLETEEGPIRDEVFRAIGYVNGRIDSLMQDTNEASQASALPKQPENPAIVAQAPEVPKETSKGVQTTPAQPLFKEAWTLLSTLALWLINIGAPFVAYSIMYKKATTQECTLFAGLAFFLTLVVTIIWMRTGTSARTPFSKIAFSIGAILLVFITSFVYTPRTMEKNKDAEQAKPAQQKVVETSSPDPSASTR